ncbi:hypothetical protein C8R45DRAFT_789554, partial [Mycena sanguinolenta]
GPLLPPAYFKIISYPHSTDLNMSIIPLGSSLRPKIFGNQDISDSGGDRPWYPFRTHADFEAAEIAVIGGLNPCLTDNLFKGACGIWTDGCSRITIRHSNHLQELLAGARQDGVKFKFEYRDPWEWIVNMLNDGTLADTTMYNSVQKYYCEGSRTVTHEERGIDEPNTA